MKKVICQFGGVKVTVIDRATPSERKERLKEPLTDFYRKSRGEKHEKRYGNNRT